MKTIKFMMTCAVVMLVSIWVSCVDKDPLPDPTVVLTELATDATSITVKVDPAHAMECYVAYNVKGAGELDVATIMANGVQVSATEATEYKIDSLAPQTTYIIYAAVRAENKSAVSSIELTTAKDNSTPAEGEFKVSFDVESASVNVTVVPQDATKPYFYYIMEKTTYEETYMGNAALAAQSDINIIINEYLDFVGGTPADALSEMLLTGESTSYFPVKGNRQYICYVCYASPQDGTVIGDVEIYEFAGPEVAPSANTFTIEVLSTTFRSIEYAIIPSNDDQYSYSLISKEQYEQQSVEEYIANMIYMNGLFMPATSGYYSSLEEYLMADTEYVLIVFGYQAGVCTTEPTIQTIRTNPQGDASQCQFEINIQALNRYQIGYDIVPSDNNVVYYYDVCYGNATADELKSMLDAAIDEQVSMGWLSNRAEYFSIWASFGMVNDATLVSPDEKGFKVYAVAIDSKTGDYGGDFYFSDVCYMPEFTASDITVGCNINQYFDGAQLAEAIPMFYAGWGEEFVFFTPEFTFENGEPVAYYYQVYQYDPAYEDYETYNEDWAIPALLQMGYPYPGMELYMPWGVSGYLMCVAMDAEGNFSKLYRQKIEFDREGATPAEQHPYYSADIQYTPAKKAAAKENNQRTKISTLKR